MSWLLKALTVLALAAIFFITHGCSDVKRIGPPAAGPNQQAKDPTPGKTLPTNTALTEKVCSALKGNPERSRQYVCLYLTFIDLVESNAHGWKKVEDMEACMEGTRKILDLAPGEIPAFQTVVKAHLEPVKANSDFTDAVRDAWRQKLGELASACVEASKQQ